MHEILQNLTAGDRVLDLGSGAGSFDASAGAFLAIRADLDRPAVVATSFVQADAARLPFADRAFDALISNHSLEHFEDLTGALVEIGRVLQPSGALYIAVPDASTFCDRLYRWLSRGGGHVNPFTSAPELAARIERATGLSHAATRTLFTSLSYLNRKNRRDPAPKRLLLMGGGAEFSLHVFTYFARFSDRFLGTRLSVYGWALYFGHFPAPIETGVWSNVCVRCGSGAPSAALRTHRLGFLKTYACPRCGTADLFSEDRHYQLK